MKNTILSIRNVSKIFPGVKALNKVSMDIFRGEMHAVVGENGAGKSTLMKILSGIYKEDEGEIYINDEQIHFKSVSESIAKGISIVHQELNIVPCLSVAENIFLGRIPSRKLFIKSAEMNRVALQGLKTIGSNINPKTLMEYLTIAEAQMVEIVRAISFSSEILILDEPTSSLSNHETENLFNILRKLKQQGITIIYISHKLEEVFKMCDRITVIRDGCVIGTVNTSEISREKIIEMMVGRLVEEEFPPRIYTPDDTVVLSVKDLMVGKNASPITFELKRGEVLGFSGLVGSGRTEVVKALFGAEKKYKGEVKIKGKVVDIKSPTDAIRHGVALLTESRAEGIIYRAPVTWNTSFANIKGICRLGMINFTLERKVTKEFIVRLKIKTPSLNQYLLNLSGGNQQKVILSKWLFAKTDILIMDEATRGIDVGAKFEIYQLINQMTAEGKSIIFISSELPEVLAMSDRVLIMANGHVAAVLDRDEFTPEKVMNHAVSKGGYEN